MLGSSCETLTSNSGALFCGQDPGGRDYLALRLDAIRVRRFRRALPHNSGSEEQCANESELLEEYWEFPPA